MVGFCIFAYQEGIYMRNFDKNCLRLYAVTDRSWLGEEPLYTQVEKALKGGATMIQLREKELDEVHFEQEAREIQQLCKTYKVPLIINDNVVLAKRINAVGVHIGQSDMQLMTARQLLGDEKIIGVTAKTVQQAKDAEKAGADYLGSGAVFGSSTKTDAKPMKHTLLQQICESVSIPVVAIGGITSDNVLQLSGRGIAGIAVVSGIFASPDIEAETRNLLELVNNIL